MFIVVRQLKICESHNNVRLKLLAINIHNWVTCGAIAGAMKLFFGQYFGESGLHHLCNICLDGFVCVLSSVDGSVVNGQIMECIQEVIRQVRYFIKCNKSSYLVRRAIRYVAQLNEDILNSEDDIIVHCYVFHRFGEDHILIRDDEQQMTNLVHIY